MISLDEARAALFAACPPVPPAAVPVADAWGCVLAAGVVAVADVPPWDNTAVDGYALRAQDLTGDATELAVLGTVAAGASTEVAVGPGQAWKVMTGAPLPPGADAVAMVELTSAATGPRAGSAGDRVTVNGPVSAGQGIRRAGSDVRAGAVVIAAGTALRAAHLGVLGSVGATTVSVFARLRVGVLVTGDELVTDGAPLRPGQIHESNRAMLMALLRQANCAPVDLGVAGDDVDELADRLVRAAAGCDVVLTSGGVSMGDADPVKAALERLGRLNWVQVAIRPAKPFAYGVLDATDRPVPVLGLPGNPVSSLVSFELLARPALRQMMGHVDAVPAGVLAVADDPLPRPHGDGRTAYLRVATRYGDDGRLHARAIAAQESHQLSATAGADALARVADGRKVEAGDELTVFPLSG